MHCIIHTPTPNRDDSLDFYRRLKFKVIQEQNPLLVSDGKALIEINPDRFARAGVKMFKDSWTDEIKQLEKLTTVTPNEQGFQLADPSGVWIYLVQGSLDADFQPTETCHGMTGNFAGLSLESGDLARSAELYNLLGFSVEHGSAEQGWMAMRHGDFGISLMKPLVCPHLFFNPSMTYFNGKENNPKVIQAIRDARIPITEEITHFNKEGSVDNIIIRDPGGYGFFLFND